MQVMFSSLVLGICWVWPPTEDAIVANEGLFRNLLLVMY